MSPWVSISVWAREMAMDRAKDVLVRFCSGLVGGQDIRLPSFEFSEGKKK